MTHRILVVENFSPDEYGVKIEDVVRLFAGDMSRVVMASSSASSFQLVDAGQVQLPKAARKARTPYEFYAALIAYLDGANETVLRVSSPNYPLSELLWTEIRDGFAQDNYDYVLSTGDECGLQGYFVERLSKAAMKHIAAQSAKVMPPGYFNASLMERAGRHWFSLDLRRFYYEDQFDAMFDSPRYLSINAIGQCNFTCRKCQYHSSEIENKRQYQGAMSLDRFKTILDKAKAYKRLVAIYPTITGEPLLHPDIVELVRMIREAGYQCAFTTNASLLTEKMTRDLLDAGVGALAFSLDTTDPEMYHHLQEGGDLSETEKNIMYFQEQYAKKYGGPAGTVNFVLSEVNESNREAYHDRWRDSGFTVQFSTYYDIFDNNRPYYNDPQWGPGDRRPCWALWHGLFLSDEGRVVSCGSMAKTLGVKENIFDMDAEELWRCAALDTLRKQQLTGVRPGYCKEFNCWTGMISTWVGEEDDVVLHSQSFYQYQPHIKVDPKAAWKNLPRRVAKSLLNRLT